jgi:hypothetical protein
VPQRSNLFQKVVRVLHQEIAAEATVEESGFLVDADTGQEREVDVLIKTVTASHELIVAIEATSTGRKADVSWVESMLKKHEKLPSDKLVLVSEAGFSNSAREKAEKNGATPIAPEDLPEDFDGGDVIHKLSAIYPKSMSLDLLNVEANCDAPNGTGIEKLEPPPTVELFLEDGTRYGTLRDLVAAHFHERFLKIADQVDLANVTEKVEKNVTLALTDATVRLQGNGDPQRLCLKPMVEGNSLGLWPVRDARLKAKMTIEAGEIPLVHKRLARVSEAYSFGEGQVGESKATFVVSQTDDGPRGRMILEGTEETHEGEIHRVDQEATED